MLLSLLLDYCAELTAAHTSAALNALSLLDRVRSKLVSGSNVIGLDDSINRAVLSALATADTLVLVNGEGKKVLTYAGRALLVHNVSDILLAEEL